ncbi:MAG: hypothetical protein NVSMB18_00390 [Acetobacteraceae bacterium]
MCSVRLADLPRTTSFRLALLFLLLFSASSAALFGLLYSRTSLYLRAQVDEWLRREQASFGAMDDEAYLERLAAHSAADPTVERPFTLIDARGQPIAGTRLDLPGTVLASMPTDRPFDFRVPIAGRDVKCRGLASRRSLGTLLVAQELTGAERFDELLVRTFLSGGLIILLLALPGLRWPGPMPSAGSTP